MYDLNYDPAICAACPTIDCLTRCQYMDFDLDSAKEQRRLILAGQKAKALEDCLTCYACEQRCPNGNHPFYLMVERQEQLGLWPAPLPLIHQQEAMMAPRRVREPGPLHDPVINMCFFPMLTRMVRGDLFKGASYFVGSDIFCNVMWLHTAGNSTIRQRLPKVIETIWKEHLEPNGISEIVCYHDECYGAYTQLAPAFNIDVPWKSIHLYEYLLERLTGLKDKIKPLGLTVAYQQPCSSRLSPQMQPLVDDIFALIGAQRPQRQYDRDNALCCGGVPRLHQRDQLADDILRRNIDDMKAVGAQFCVFNCPACLMTMGHDVFEAGVIPILMSELCQMALGEQMLVMGG